MKRVLFITIFATFGLQAAADGFVCRSTEESLAVAVYNNTASPATRSAAVMVVSDPKIGFGNKTIARFLQETGTLTNKGANYVGRVDLNVPDTARSGENIGGTKLGLLKQISLNLDFTYSRPVPDGEELGGTMLLTKLNGEVIEIEMDCLRYLKGE